MTNDTLLVEPMLDDYPADATPGWTHTNNGHHIVVNSRFGQLEIGQVPGMGYDQWLFHEIGGGGALAVGYAWIEGKLHLMTLKANRFNLVGDEDDWEAAGGFIEDGEPKLVTAIRELLEETGQLANPVPVQGRGFVGNRAFFKLDGEHEGTEVFMFELTDEHVEAISNSDKLDLMHWKQASRISRDALSIAAFARVTAELLDD